MRVTRAAAALLLGAVLGLSASVSVGHELPPQTREMTGAALAFLKLLRPELKSECLLPLPDPERLRWSYLPGRRRGVSLKQMNEAERRAAHALLAASLSARGGEKAEGVLELEGILGRIERFFGRDPQLYYVTFFGVPSEESAWAWRFEGHHLSLHFSSWSGAIVSSTPAFFGANPARVDDGPRAGWRLLGAEEDLARQLLASLEAALQRTAILAGSAPSDILLGPGRKDVPDPAGVAHSEMPPASRTLLERLVGEYVGNLRDAFAREQREKIEKAGWGNVRFAWAGGRNPGEGHYYRVQGPTFLIEYDNTQGGANHVHSVYRDLENDVLGDVLRRHYAEYPHGETTAPALARSPGGGSSAAAPRPGKRDGLDEMGRRQPQLTEPKL
jgi:Protein of unknown function (DUF3500)